MLNSNYLHIVLKKIPLKFHYIVCAFNPIQYLSFVLGLRSLGYGQQLKAKLTLRSMSVIKHDSECAFPT